MSNQTQICDGCGFDMVSFFGKLYGVAKNIGDAFANYDLVGTVQGLAWPAVTLFFLLFIRSHLYGLLGALVQFLKRGSTLKLGMVEISGPNVATLAAQNGPVHSSVESTSDEKGIYETIRKNTYLENKSVFFIHRLWRSNVKNQEFDVEIALLPHRGVNIENNGTLAVITEVRYYVGTMWGAKVFIARNRWNNFAISVCAYGPFLCIAEVEFCDNTFVRQYRYIDFEMGRFAPSHDG